MAERKELFTMFNEMYEKSVRTPSSATTPTVSSNPIITKHVSAEMDEHCMSHVPDLSTEKQNDEMSDSVMSQTTRFLNLKPLNVIHLGDASNLIDPDLKQNVTCPARGVMMMSITHPIQNKRGFMKSMLLSICKKVKQVKRSLKKLMS
ncbi:hypothetical protein C2S51_007080 [Perilla frutescens var. frutescens]|nr:hypothetical protein C2S51_007080 [Perilla frutescens var. frutescens]